MLGSAIISNILYNIYGDTPPPASASTRCAKELYDALIKVQRMREWWFARSEATYSLLANTNEIDLAPLGITIAEIYSLSAETTNVLEYPLTRVRDEDFPIEATVAYPSMYREEFIDYDDHTLNIYPTPDVAFTYELEYRKLYVPEDPITHLPSGYADMATMDDSILDILDQYLEAVVTSRMCVVLDYNDKAITYANVGSEELENLVKQNYDYNKSGQNFAYGGI